MKRLSRQPHWTWQHPDWPGFTWDAAAVVMPLTSARRAQGALAAASRLLDVGEQSRADADLFLVDALETSHIEGEKPDPKSVRSSIARRLGLPYGGLPAPSRDVDGLVEVLLDATTHHAAPVTLDRLCAWQAALFPTGRSGLVAVRVGSLRGAAPMRIVSGPAGRERVHYEAVPHRRLPAEMARFLEWFDHPPGNLDALLHAGIAHVWFELLHPFEDGNGRVGRALLDLSLARDERGGRRLFGLSKPFMQERSRYYAELEAAGRGALDVTAWLLWFLERVQSACLEAQRNLDAVLAKTRFWMRHAQVPLNERQRKALNRLLDAGPGGFEGGMTTRKYASLGDVSRATAFRELNDLVVNGCLVPNEKGGRASAYEIDWPTFSDPRK